MLERLIAESDPHEYRANDPVDLVWRYDDPHDREVVALIASCLAYGRVALLKRAVGQVLDALGPAPAAFLRAIDPASLAGICEGFVYRMTREDDVRDLLAGISRVLLEHGTLEACYASGAGDTHLERASAFVQRLRAGRLRAEVARGLAYLLPDPADGSTCKRLHLFFRWVARGQDGVDLGLWSTPAPAELVMPLDTHTSRLSRYLGLTGRASVDGKMALEVTDALRALDADDPLRYDFALCHLGISGRCIHRRSDEHCPGCPIEAVCALPWLDDRDP